MHFDFKFKNRISSNSKYAIQGTTVWIVMGGFLYKAPPVLLPQSVDHCPEGTNLTFVEAYQAKLEEVLNAPETE